MGATGPLANVAVTSEGDGSIAVGIPAGGAVGAVGNAVTAVTNVVEGGAAIGGLPTGMTVTTTGGATGGTIGAVAGTTEPVVVNIGNEGTAIAGTIGQPVVNIGDSAATVSIGTGTVSEISAGTGTGGVAVDLGGGAIDTGLNVDLGIGGIDISVPAGPDVWVDRTPGCRKLTRMYPSEFQLPTFVPMLAKP